MSEDIAISSNPAKRKTAILVVEDVVYLRFTLAEWLRTLNYIVYEAATADEAVQILDSLNIVDLVITDVDMPGTMDGIGLVEHIQNMSSGMEIIVVSGHAHSHRAKEKGVAFFKKPYDFHALSSYIEKVIPTESIEGENERSSET